MVEVSSPKPNGVHFKWRRQKKKKQKKPHTHNTGSSAGGCLITSRNYTSDSREFYSKPQICRGVTSPWILCFPLFELGGEREGTDTASKEEQNGADTDEVQPPGFRRRQTLLPDRQQDHRRQEWCSWEPWPPTDVAQPGTSRGNGPSLRPGVCVVAELLLFLAAGPAQLPGMAGAHNLVGIGPLKSDGLGLNSSCTTYWLCVILC